MPPRTFGPLSTTRYVVNGVAFDTVRVPPGRFVDDEGWDKRALLISRPFEIGTTLVTQALWRAVMGTSPSHFRGDDLPVEQVSWGDAQAFLGQIEALGLRGFRLPTEAEWAWAARCGGPTRWAGADRDKPVAVAGRRSAALVGALRSSAVGALDLSGNLKEWQQDWWSDAPAAGVDAQRSPPVDMQDLASTSEPESGFVHRGGGWGNFPQATRVAERDFGYPHHRDPNLGVRLLRTAPRSRPSAS